MNQDFRFEMGKGKMKPSPPFFIVGAPRSGTTLLAALLDKHSNIAIGPETQFFTEFIPWNWAHKAPKTYEELVDSALEFKRIADFRLDRDRLLRHFKQYDLSFANLLRAIIEMHALDRSKLRPGEKIPLHLEHVPLILHQFPGSKVIYILRDGRDVVRSLLEVPWAAPHNPRRFRRFCMRWTDAMEAMFLYEKTLPADQFMIVKFEALLMQPKSELAKICGFLGEKFEPTQLEPVRASSAVPEWEKDWKGKAAHMPDAARVQAWRQSSDQQQIWIMNSMMGNMLERAGYSDTKLDGCPPLMRVRLLIEKIPYQKRVRKFSSLALKILKKMNLAKWQLPAEERHA
jgi:hypothetical protein